MVKLQMAPKILSWEKVAIMPIVLTVAGLKLNSIFGDYFLGREGGGVFVIRSCMLDIKYKLVLCSST
jgi:hypothetical protein